MPVLFTYIDSPMGKLLLTSEAGALTGVWFHGQKYFPRIESDWVEHANDPVLKHAARELRDYFAGKRDSFEVAVKPSGTPFQESVWRALRKIPFAATMTYGDVARKMGKPSAVRAVAAAIGRNPISIIVPCHRVMGADGSLTGYAGGIKRKQGLLVLESGQTDAFD